MKNLNSESLVWIVVGVALIASVWLLSSRPRENGNISVSPVATTTETSASSTSQSQAGSAQSSARPGGAAKQPSAAPGAAKVAGYNTLGYLMSLKDSLTCTVNVSTAYTKRSGTAFVSGGKLRANFTSYIDGYLTNTSMIDDGSYIYVWTQGTTGGLRLPAPSSVSGSVAANDGGVDPMTPVAFVCNSWVEDPGVFAAPSSIVFTNNP